MGALSRARVSLLVVTVLVLQLTAGAAISVGGVHPDLMVLVAVTAGLVGGPDRGAVVGFASGLLADLFVHAPFGLSALAFTVVGYAVGIVHNSVLRATWPVAVLTAALGCAGGEALYAAVGAIVGESSWLTGRLEQVVAVVGSLDAAFAVVALPAMAWAMQVGRRRRSVSRVDTAKAGARW